MALILFSMELREVTIREGCYSITHVQSNKALEVVQASASDGGDISIGATSRQWPFMAINNGYYRIVNRNSGKDLDVWEQAIIALAEIKQCGYWGGENQEWGLTRPNGYARNCSYLGRRICRGTEQ